MSDLRLRQLAREVDRLGTDTARAALLCERARAGLLPADGLELAAYLGHVPARLTFGNGRRWPSRTPRSYIHRLTQWGREVCVRAGVAAAWPQLTSKTFRRVSVRKLLEATEEWVLCPCREHGRVWANLQDLSLPDWVTYIPVLRSTRLLIDAVVEDQPLLYSDRLKAIKTELIPWALGGEDALADRQADRAYGRVQIETGASRG